MKHIKTREERSREHIAALRMGKNLSQAEFAELIDVSVNTINRFENNKTTLSAELAIKLAEQFHVSMDYLFGYSPYEDREPPCESSCEALINAQNTVELLQNRVRELEGKLKDVQTILGSKPIKLKKRE